jgi:hypothetical protein
VEPRASTTATSLALRSATAAAESDMTRKARARLNCPLVTAYATLARAELLLAAALQKSVAIALDQGNNVLLAWSLNGAPALGDRCNRLAIDSVRSPCLTPASAAGDSGAT